MPTDLSENPIAELVSDDTYDVLKQHDLLREKGVRNYRMRQRFEQMSACDVPARDAIRPIREDHPYLQFDTVRKIVYQCC